jgi:thiamine-phosphate pyrophosphorylase
MPFVFPKIYPILDSSFIPTVQREDSLRRLGASLVDAGVTLLEYRNKTGRESELIADTKILRSVMPRDQAKLILDDRADLVDAACFDGVHLDGGDMLPSSARQLLGPDRIIGTFGGGDALVPGVLSEPVDYFAVGPVFTTTTKKTDKQPIGIAGVKRIRELAGPNVVLSAAAGITLETASSVLAAGANVVAVSAALFSVADPAAEFRRWHKYLG